MEKDHEQNNINYYVTKTLETKQDLKSRVLECCSNQLNLNEASINKLHDLLTEMGTHEKELTEVLKAARHLIRKELQGRNNG